MADLRRKACGGKRKYTSLREANETIEYLGKTAELTAYECSFCNEYHIGHKR